MASTCVPQPGGIGMGLGKLSTDSLVFKRKYRWTFELNAPSGNIPASFVKLAARPNLTIEETEINYLHGKMWIPGKGTWETITVTYYDVGGNSGDVGGMANLYGWLATIYDFTSPSCLHQSSRKGGYAGTARLELNDGCGQAMEKWTLSHAWPQAINFGELDYSSSEEVTIELTLRYAEVEFEPLCGVANIIPICKGCS